MAAAEMHDPGHQARDLRRAAATGDAHDRDPAAVIGVGEQVVDDRAANRLRRAFGGLEVHQQPRPGVHFDHRAALRVQGLGDVLGHHVDAGHVEADGARGQRHHMRHLGVDQLGAVDRDVAVALDQHPLARWRHAVGREALALQVEQDHAVLAWVEAVERVVFGQAAARVVVDLRIDQLGHVQLAIAHHPGRLAARGGDQLAADHQHAVLVAADVALDDHLAAMAVGHRPGGLDLGLRAQVERDAAAVVAVGRLDHHRQADVLRRVPGLGRAGDDLAFGHRHADRLEQALGQIFFAGDAFGNGAGEVGLGGPDAALALAVAELHQVAVIEADVRNAALGGGGDDRRGAGAEIAVVELFAHRGHGRGHVEGLVVDGTHQQPVAALQRGACDLLVAGPKHHAVDAALAGAAGLAKAGRHAGQVEQLDHHMLEYMAAPGAAFEPLQKAAALADAAVVLHQRRQPGAQALVHAGQRVGRMIFEFAEIEPGLQHGAVGPDVGAAQVVDAQQLDVVLLVHLLQLRASGTAGESFELCARSGPGSSARIAPLRAGCFG